MRLNKATARLPRIIQIQKLNKWLFDHGMTKVELGDVLSISYPKVLNLVRGRSWPSLRDAATIHLLTNGDVNIFEWTTDRSMRREKLLIKKAKIKLPKTREELKERQKHIRSKELASKGMPYKHL